MAELGRKQREEGKEVGPAGRRWPAAQVRKKSRRKGRKEKGKKGKEKKTSFPLPEKEINSQKRNKSMETRINSRKFRKNSGKVLELRHNKIKLKYALV
jgi:hypothetical protein